MRVRTLLTVLIVSVLVLCTGGYFVARYLGENLKIPVSAKSCTVTAGGTVTLDADQLANAATIAAVGIRRKLPERAVVVALATAWQESKIRNLSGGDRDSIGLFQQRPSMGWGTPEQIADQRYASGKFYDKLLKVPGWQDMRVTDAAQAVQVSAHPELYEQWVEKSEILTRALGGSAGQAVACTLPGDPKQQGATAVTALADALKADWGQSGATKATTMDLKPRDAQAGWQYAHWLVARAEEHGVRAVRYAGMEWTAKDGSWSKKKGAAAETVTAEVSP
ncbi:hypothetical protein R8Z50_30995 [Longispora sp. K20-0274]|uniref:hypothetical protein n=1 Tax=Longispora sp. K20-0274 TaxID=3088255 RepID=UPI00399C12BC